MGYVLPSDSRMFTALEIWMLKNAHLLWVSFLVAVGCANAAEQTKELVQVPITAGCRSMYFAPGDARQKENRLPVNVPWDPSKAKPISFKDPRSDLLFYVESDGRHIAAMNSDGKLLWVRNPFEDARYCPYRTPRPVVASIFSLENMPESLVQLLQGIGVDITHKFLSVTFDSSQFGALDEITGNYYPMGQN